MRALSNVSFVKGNCLEPSTYRDHLNDVDAVIHTVGVLFDSRDPTRSYRAMNRDCAVNIARDLNQTAVEQGVTKQFVMLSSEKSLPFA